jgi:hypothetical protein
MARIKLGPLVTDIAGSVGGATFQRSRFGMTIRSKPLPLYSETSAQYLIRRLIISLQYSWQGLTNAERLQWNRFLDFSGQTIRRDRSIKLSGQTLYIKYQLWRLMYDQELLTDIAYAPMPDHYNFLTIERAEEPEYHLRFSGVVDVTKYFFICKLTSPRRENQAYNPRGLRWMDVIFLPTALYDITTSYVAAFGALPSVGDFCHYSIQFFSMTSPVYTGVFTGKAEVILLV